MGTDDVSALRDVGEWMAMLKEPEPPKGLRDCLISCHCLNKFLNMPVKRLSKSTVSEIVLDWR